jgi:hypothetical protein
MIKQNQDLSLQGKRVRCKNWHWQSLILKKRVEGIGERIVAYQTTVFSSPDAFLLLENAKVV